MSRSRRALSRKWRVLEVRAETAEALAASRLNLLRRAEWCRWDGVGFTEYKCPCCEGYKRNGHHAGCEMAKALDDEQ